MMPVGGSTDQKKYREGKWNDDAKPDRDEEDGSIAHAPPAISVGYLPSSFTLLLFELDQTGVRVAANCALERAAVVVGRSGGLDPDQCRDPPHLEHDGRSSCS